MRRVDGPGGAPIPSARLGAADIVQARRIAADPAATVEELLGLRITHPQIFLALAGRPQLPARVRTALFKRAGRGAQLVVEFAETVDGVRFESVSLTDRAWLSAFTTMDGLSVKRLERIATRAGALAPVWLKGDDWGFPLRALLAAPACSFSVVAEFLTQARWAGPGGVAGAVYTCCVADLVERDHPVGLLERRVHLPGWVALCGPADRFSSRDVRSLARRLDTLPAPALAAVTAWLPTWSGSFADLVETAVDATR